MADEKDTAGKEGTGGAAPAPAAGSPSGYPPMTAVTPAVPRPS